MSNEVLIPIDENTLGGRLRLARQRKGYTVSQLARKVGMSQPHLSQVELNERSIALPKVLRLAKVLDVSPAWLLPGQELPTTRQVPLANSVREVVELSILIREGRIGEWEGDMVEIAVDAPGEFCVVCPDDSMGDRPKRGDVVSCTLDVRLADGAVVVLKVPDCDYPILRLVQKDDSGTVFVPRRKVQGKYVDRVYREDEAEVLARALEIVRGKL